MTRNIITDLDYITGVLDPTGAIEAYLWEELTDDKNWHSVKDIARHLETASCANGDWDRVIHPRDILAKLSYDQWQWDIDDALDSYVDAHGYGINITSLESVVIFAVDWVAQTLASRLRNMRHVWMVTVSVDSLDPSPDVIAFADEFEVFDWVACEIESRVQYLVDHSPYAITDADREALHDAEAQLFTITGEVI